MSKLTLDEVCDLIVKSVPALSGPAKGALVFVRIEREENLRDLAIRVASALSKNKLVPVFLVQGHVRGEYAWPFSRIKRNPRLRLEPNGQIVTETGGLIFPQDEPVVLLVECFDCFEHSDQRAYSHLVDGEGGEWALHEGSVLIAGLLSTNPGHLEAGASNRGSHFELA